MNARPWQRHLSIALVLGVGVVIGALTVSDYGESWDEREIFLYSENVIQAYGSPTHSPVFPPIDPNLRLYGPSFFMAVNYLARPLLILRPEWPQAVAWHFVYFLTFLLGGLALYRLCVRWTSHLAGLGAMLLFITQPLLWGHAFINPKDTPFMALFTIAICLGLHMIEAWRPGRLLTGRLVLAAILLGVVSSFRVAGPLAGLIVAGFAIKKQGAKGIPSVALYLGLAAATAYVSWPYLWPAPVSRWVESARTMATFPWPAEYLFRGQYYTTSHMPAEYFPALLGIQLTEPALLLTAAGLAASIFRRGRISSRGPLELAVAWFLIPAGFVIINRSPLYDNARQLYFLLPPLFVLAGVGLEWIFSYCVGTAPRAAILVGAVLPGLLGIMALQPYSYVYYNTLVGGTGGAYRRYEMDYFATSFKEVAGYLNSNANRGANVLVYNGPPHLLRQQLRPDLDVGSWATRPSARRQYVVILNRWIVQRPEDMCPDAEVKYSVGRRGAVFAVLLELPRHAQCSLEQTGQ